jgi:hypothetical protein
MDCDRGGAGSVGGRDGGALEWRRRAADVAAQGAKHDAAQASGVKDSEHAAAGDGDVLARARDFAHEEKTRFVLQKAPGKLGSGGGVRGQGWQCIEILAEWSNWDNGAFVRAIWDLGGECEGC